VDIDDGWSQATGDSEGLSRAISSNFQVMNRLDHRLALDEKQLNISCLLYSPGQCIPWHADRRGGEGTSPVSFFPMDSVEVVDSADLKTCRTSPNHHSFPHDIPGW
jgi:hypothetical protein